MRCPSCQRDSIEITGDFWAHFVAPPSLCQVGKNPPHQQQPFAAEAPAQHGHLELVVMLDTKSQLAEVGTKNKKTLPSRARSRIPPMEEENKIIGTQLLFDGDM